MKHLLFSTSSYEYLKDQLIASQCFEEGALVRKTFPDGENYLKFESDVEHKNIVLLGGTGSDRDVLELYDMACGLVGYGAKRLHIVIPYFGYSTMERAVKRGEVVTAKTRARLLSAIPQAYYGNHFILVDLHVAGLQHYFEGASHVSHIYAKPLIMNAARKLGGDNFVLASTDAGRAKWVESLANDLGVEPAFVYKQRLSGAETKLTGVNADVKGKTVVIYDDMIRTGGSLIQAAKAYKEAGAGDIHVLSTHAVMPEGAREKIESSGYVKSITVTDTHPRARLLENSFLHVETIAPLIVEALRLHPSI